MKENSSSHEIKKVRPFATQKPNSRFALYFGGKAEARSTIAQSLHTMLFVVMIVLSVTCFALCVVGVFMLFSNGLRDNILDGVEGKGISPQAHLIALNCFAFAIMSAVYLSVILILRKIVNTLLSGDPFVPENISRLRIMWIVLAISEVFRMITHMFLANGENGDGVLIKIRLGTWFMVFVIAALAEVFRHGAELRRDQELTV